MISFCEISRQNFPQHRYFVIWSLARASVRSSGGGGGGRELEENWVGDVCLDIKRLQISQGILTEINKKLKQIRILISRPNSTPKQKSKKYDIYERIQTKMGDRGSNCFPSLFSGFFPLVFFFSTAKYEALWCNFSYLRPVLSYSASSNFPLLFFRFPIICPPPLRQGGSPTPCPLRCTFPPVWPDNLLSRLSVKRKC